MVLITSETDPNADDEACPLWADETADQFEALVLDALDSLPEAFRDRLGSVAIVIEDEPTPAPLGAVGAPGLFGFYTGGRRAGWGADDAAVASKITIYRGAHLRQSRAPDSLARGVADTVRHEIAHHFGISDARLDELARARHGR